MHQLTLVEGVRRQRRRKTSTAELKPPCNRCDPVFYQRLNDPTLYGPNGEVLSTGYYAYPDQIREGMAGLRTQRVKIHAHPDDIGETFVIEVAGKTYASWSLELAFMAAADDR